MPGDAVRPIYETEADVLSEGRVADLLGQRWKCTVVKLHKLNVLDYALVRNGKLKALVEIKNRTTPSGTYPTYFVSAKKWLDARQFSRDLKIPVFLVVGFTDGVKYIDFSVEPDFVGVGGRFDRGDRQDIEPMAHFEVTKMTDLLL